MQTSQEHFFWDDTRVFLAVARSGTLTQAATDLGEGIATVSRRIKRLEAAFGIPLFVHHQTGYRMTDDARALLHKAEALEQAAQMMRRQASSEAISGRVRLATAENLAVAVIIPTIPALRLQHPQLELEILTGLNTVNLHRHDADLALRLVKTPTGNIISRRIGTLGFGLYGSKQYLASRGLETEPHDFSRHDFIGWVDTHKHLPSALWLERNLNGRRPVLATTSLRNQLSAACSGLGLALLPHFLTAGTDLRLLPIELGVDQPIWLSMQADLVTSRRVKAVADHLLEVIRQREELLANPSSQ